MSLENPKEKAQMSRVLYASAIGSLMYVMLCTRADVYFAVGLVSRCQSDLGLSYWKVIKRILRYLKGTSDSAMCYQGNDLHLKGYIDANYGGDLDDQKSTSAYVVLLNIGAVSWSSKKQSCAALSTIEVEIVALSTAAQEAV